jgi:hypothetical protein
MEGMKGMGKPDPISKIQGIHCGTTIRVEEISGKATKPLLFSQGHT